MAVDIAELRVRLTANTAGLKQGLAEATGEIVRARSTLEGFGGSVVAINQGVELLKNTFGLVAAAARTLVAPIEAAVEASAEQDRALIGLENTLQTSGQLTADYADQLGRLADAQALVKNVSDDAVIGVERTLVAFGAQRAQIPQLVG